MPQVPTRDSFTQVESGIGGARVATQDLRGVPSNSGIRPSQLQTPQLRVDNQVAAKFTQPVQPGVTMDQATAGARQAKALGRAVEGAGDTLGDLALQLQIQANATIVDDQVTRLSRKQQLRMYGTGLNGEPLGFSALKGEAAVFRDDGKNLADEYGEAFDNDIVEAEGQLKNDAQRRAFRAQADRMGLSLRNAATQHASQEFRTYNMSVQNGTIKAATESLALNYTNPEITGTVKRDGDMVRGDGEWGRLIGAVATVGRMNGRADEEIKADQLTAVSTVHRRIIGAALQGDNIVGADAWLKAHSDQMTADDILATKMVVTKEMDNRIGLVVAQDAVKGVVAQSDQTPMGNFLGVIKQLETGSGSGFNKDGSMVEGPKTRYGTAKGPMQVLDGTNKDPGFGVKPAKDDSPEERTRVGIDYANAMIRYYKGDAGLALAAYNWGPGNVDKARKETAGEGPNAWFNKAPAETRAYVTNGLAKLRGNAGMPPPPTIDQVMAAIDADPRIAGNPARVEAAKATARRSFADFTAGREQREASVYATAVQAIDSGTPYDQLPVALRHALPAEKIPPLRSFSDSMGAGPAQSDPAVYLKLADDDTLRKLSDEQFYAMKPLLNDSDFKKFAEQRGKAPTDNKPGNLNGPAINTALTGRLQALGFNPNPGKDAPPEEVQRVAAIKKLIRDKIYLAQANSGKQFTDVETEQFIDREFTRNVQYRNGTVGPQLAMTSPNAIPKANLDAVRYRLQNAGVKNPTNTQLLNAYWRD